MIFAFFLKFYIPVDISEFGISFANKSSVQFQSFTNFHVGFFQRFATVDDFEVSRFWNGLNFGQVLSDGEGSYENMD